MNKSYKQLHIGTYFDIPVFIHWTFSFFVLYILYTAYQLEFDTADTFWYITFVAMLFLFVILHEYGHALMAKKFGVKTRDIIISPIGGIARLQEIPENPKEELQIAVAGPAVNLVLGAFFLIIVLCFSNTIFPQSQTVNFYDAPLDYIRYLLLINISLVFFNMLPAFPMDGGRVLRALLSFKFNRVKATYIAMIIAQVMAVAFLLIGLYFYHVVLIMIAGFIFITSRSEYRSTINSTIFKIAKASDALIQNPITFSEHDSIQEVQSRISPLQSSFMIHDESEKILGVIPGPILKQADANSNLQPYISQNYGTVSEETSLESLFSIMNNNGWYIVHVVDAYSNPIGILDRSSVESYVESRKKTNVF